MAQPNQKGVVALVGAGGIGIAIARRVAQGKHLVVTSRTQVKADRIAADLQRDGFEATGVACDLGSRVDILCDGGSTAAYWYGDLQYLQEGWAQS